MAQPTLKLRSLGISNFRSYVGNHELQLPESGLVMVLGDNKDTGESSGSGKSSLVEAPAFAFDYSQFSATDLQSWSWLTEEAMSVRLGLWDARKGEVKLQRGKRASIQFGSDAPITSAKAIKESLQQLLGVRPEVLRALTYRPQKAPGLFLSMTDSEKKGFLTELLGLQQYETEADRVVQAITQLERDEEVKAALAHQARQQVPSEPSALELEGVASHEQQVGCLKEQAALAEAELRSMSLSDRFFVEAQVAREKRARSAYEPAITELTATLRQLRAAPIQVPAPELPAAPEKLAGFQEKLAFIRGQVSKLKTEHQTKLRTQRAELQTLRGFVEGLARIVGKKAEAESRLLQAGADLDQMEHETCPTCLRVWSGDLNLQAALARCRDEIAALEKTKHDAELAEVEHANLVQQGKALRADVDALEAADPVPEKFRAAEQQLVDAISKMTADYEAAKAAVVRQQLDAKRVAEAERRSEVSAVESTLSTTRADLAEALATAQTTTAEQEQHRIKMAEQKELLAKLQSDVRTAADHIAAAKQRNEERRRHFEVTNAQFQTLSAAALAAEQVLVETKQRLDIERDYLGLVRGFLGSIFDDTLDRIAYLTNERLARVPNVQAFTLRFVSERETKSTKNLRQEIKPIIERDGHEIPLRAGTSGGQYTAVELAVDLSLADVIAERTGMMPNWLVLDECFEGLPIKSKRACLELLHDAAETRLIIVIDHATELKEMFSATIGIVSRDGLSSFA